ncbi:unnamed protein product [Ilex paraguariensis]|uniref:GST C-terminal domain-containing protein n=1 Tax=Ilex paraguariensis TaxID=185542 RepID=A0ABC8V3A9_9AQUA
MARFWAKFVEEKLLNAAWIATRSQGDEQENALKSAMEVLEKIEGELRGKKFFGGEAIRYLDLAVGWISFWLPVREEVGSMKILDPSKFPNINALIASAKHG